MHVLETNSFRFNTHTFNRGARRAGVRAGATSTTHLRYPPHRPHQHHRAWELGPLRGRACAGRARGGWGGWGGDRVYTSLNSELKLENPLTLTTPLTLATQGVEYDLHVRVREAAVGVVVEAGGAGEARYILHAWGTLEEERG